MTSTNPPSKKKNVYISFNGEDVGANFVSPLYEALSSKGIMAFFEGEDIMKKNIDKYSLMIAIIVFSNNYASQWCLDQLLKIMERRQTPGLITAPVFYGVGPSDVLRLTGHFGDTFARTAANSASERIEKWKAALIEAVQSSGWDSSLFGSDAEIVKRITEDVSNMIHMNSGDDTKEELANINSVDTKEELVDTEESPVEHSMVETGEWITLLSSVILEALSALFEQLNSTLVSMILAILGLILCAGELIYRARKEHVYWEKKGLRSWFYCHNSPSKNKRLFGTTIEYFQLVAALWQCFHSTMGYLFARLIYKRNPIIMSVTMLLLSLCLCISKIIKQYSVMRPPRIHEA